MTSAPPPERAVLARSTGDAGDFPARAAGSGWAVRRLVARATGERGEVGFWGAVGGGFVPLSAGGPGVYGTSRGERVLKRIDWSGRFMRSTVWTRVAGRERVG
ncbi:hypothetical protein [Actinomadura sp. 9N407]|uniref:hypothetical protein n=1 Tax=Actinomadura sp. 9N407 TaxID=3375154 RepID=UPI0037AD32C6